MIARRASTKTMNQILLANTPGLTCDEAHVYRFEGARVPGISEVMTGLGFERDEYFKEGSSVRGDVIHVVLAGHAQGLSFDWDLLHVDLHGWVKSGIAWFDDLIAKGWKVVGVETMLYSSLYRFAGRVDLIMEDPRGYQWIFDWKSGKASKVVRFKLGAYDMLAGGPYNGKPRKRAAVELDRDGGKPHLVEYNEVKYFHDANRFLGYLSTYNDLQEFAPKKTRDALGAAA